MFYLPFYMTRDVKVWCDGTSGQLYCCDNAGFYDTFAEIRSRLNDWTTLDGKYRLIMVYAQYASKNEQVVMARNGTLFA